MSYLTDISTANPAHLHTQEDVSTFYCSYAQHNPDAGRRIRAVARHSGIQSRYSVLPDFTMTEGTGSFYPGNTSSLPLPGLDKRMEVYKKEALALSIQAVAGLQDFEKLKTRVTHIITVTCTGLFAPGLDIELVKHLGLRPFIHRSSINFMGCNAAMLALKQAHQICSAEKAVVLIVCTELCTLHFQDDYSDDYILSNLLFADGSAAAIVASDPLPSGGFAPARLGRFQSMIVHEGHREMGWQLSEKGFIMNLSGYVSSLLNRHMGALLEESGISAEAVGRWAIHPGGKKILDEFRKVLCLEKDALRHSYSVLSKYGNMSSATILFVLKEMFTERALGDNEVVYTAAFGPGLTIESAILQNA